MTRTLEAMGRWDPSSAELPSSDLLALTPRLRPGGRVLDIGCGAGARNAIHFARQGFSVEAVDVDLGAVEAARDTVRGLGLEATVYQSDIRAIAAVGVYDLIICRGLLHFLEPTDWPSIFRALRRATVPGGWHALSVFTNELPIPADLAPLVRGVFAKGQLRDWYPHWDGERYESYILEDDHPGNISHRHAIDRMIVGRPR
jgi:tellurite methyltransferase